MTWQGITLTEDQRDVVDLVEQVVAKHHTVLRDDADQVDSLRAALVGAGVWTLGVPEDLGGGGAPLDLRLTALVSLGRRWAALAWAVAQVHAAAEVLSDDPASTDVLGEVLSGTATACVLSRNSTLVHLRQDGERASGSIHRVDPAGPVATVVLLGADEALVLAQDTLAAGAPLRRAGMPGARTTSVAVNGPTRTVRPQHVAVAEVRRRLQLAGAAIAAGLALEASGRAIDYSRGRVQFGAPLTALPTVRRSLFDQDGHANAAFVRAVAGTATPAQAALTLNDNCETALEVTAAAIQSHGGYGYLAEYDVEARFRDALSLRAATDAGHHAQAAAATLAPTPPAADLGPPSN